MDPPASQPARMCQKHGIVRDPFGHCVICKREDEDVDQDPSGIRLAATLLVLLAVGVAGVVFYKGAQKPKAPAPEVAAVAPAPPEQAPELDDAADAKQDALAAAKSREADERREAVDKQMKQVPIRVYTAKKCDLCRTATGFLTSKGYAFTEIDVDASRASADEMRKLNPKNTVPTIVVGDEVVVGFGPHAVLGAIYRVAQQRVR